MIPLAPPAPPKITLPNAGLGPLGYLGMLNLLLNPPLGPTSSGPQTGSSGQPMVVQEQPWGASAMSGGMQGAMAGIPFGWPGVAGGAALGYGMGSGMANDLTWEDIGALALNPFMAPGVIFGGRK